MSDTIYSSMPKIDLAYERWQKDKKWVKSGVVFGIVAGALFVGLGTYILSKPDMWNGFAHQHALSLAPVSSKAALIGGSAMIGISAAFGLYAWKKAPKKPELL